MALAFPLMLTGKLTVVFVAPWDGLHETPIWLLPPAGVIWSETPTD